ncbi:MAG: hypothetical protein JWQ39_2031 [Glaciihabitans sp.]|nr:hypothetical protein [Glaciihabitans sp.]
MLTVPESFVPDLLSRLTNGWGHRVAVKRDELDLDGHFDLAADDFPAHLVPVLALPGAGTLDPEARSRILSATWISYNAKTSAIEDEIILPACRLLLEDRIPARRDAVAISAIHQTIIDEHYHILMCHNAVGVTRRRRGMADVVFDPAGWAVVEGLNERRAGHLGIDRDLIDLAFALAAETTISGFLSTISSSSDIQPMNRITADLHRRDENGHAVIFREMVRSLYRELDPGQRDLFDDALVCGVEAFCRPDCGPWVVVAAAGELCITADQLGARSSCRSAPPSRDMAPLHHLLHDLGLTEKLGPALGLTTTRG